MTRVVALAVITVALAVGLGSGCPANDGGADAGPRGFRDADGNLNGTAGVDKTEQSCGGQVEFDLSFCQSDPEAGCKSDADCVDGTTPHRCFPHVPHCECRRSCGRDSDCDLGTACACDQNACVTAECTKASDCGSNHCGAVREPAGCREILGYKCRTATDPCDSDDDCTAGAVGDPVCNGTDAGFVCGIASGDPCNF